MNVRPFSASDAVPLCALLASRSPDARDCDPEVVTRALAEGRFTGLAAGHGGGLAGALVLETVPSVYTGRRWGHMDDVVVTGHREAVARSLVDEALRTLEQAGVADTSVAVPAGDDALERACRRCGYGDEQLVLLRRDAGAASRSTSPALATSPAHVLVRPAQTGDAGSIAALVRLFAEEYGEVSAADAASVTAYLEHPEVDALLALSADVPVGLLAFSVSCRPWSGGPCATIDDLVVRPDARRRGVAAALIGQALSGLRKTGSDRLVSLWLQDGNDTATRLYR
ncbi:MAG: GNAT family N-acetyltransferase, partial [Thermoleophilia bacterium]|nr:GNAT family N-acetyltransferase [Thermoleophilia bacterium]